MTNKERTTDALSILHRRYVGDDPARQASIEEERVHAKVARQIYELRKQAGLSQRELAERIGTTQSAISRLEDADYDGHSISVLRRVAGALGAKIDVELDAPRRGVEPYAFRLLMNYLRRSKGLTLDQLSKATSVHRDELAAIEQEEGHRPSPRTMRKLGQFYGLSPQKLAALAGGLRVSADEVREPAVAFAAKSEGLFKLSQEERRALDEFVRALHEEHHR